MPSGKDPMLRGCSLGLIAVVLAALLMDPYTFFRDAGDFVQPGPWWQRLLGLVDVSLLAAALMMVWRRRYERAFMLLGMEAIWAVGSAAILVSRDGMARFIRGLGAEPYLLEYLIVLGVRLIALACVWQAERRASRAGADPAASP